MERQGSADNYSRNATFANSLEENDAVTEENRKTTYEEMKIGKTLYRVTYVYKNEIDLVQALEDLAVRRILNADNKQ